MSEKSEYFWGSLAHNTVGISIELLGVYICYRGYNTPNVIDSMQLIFLFSLILDCLKILISFCELGILFCLKKNNLSWLNIALYAVGGVILAGSIATTTMLLFNYKNTDLASMPWLSAWYYIGIIVYALAKLIIFELGLFLLIKFVETLEKKGVLYGRSTSMKKIKYIPIYYQP